MVNREKIIFNESSYYMPDYSGTIKVSVLKLLDDERALVKQHKKNKDLKPFPIPITHIYNRAEDADKGRRAWEEYKRKMAKGKRK